MAAEKTDRFADGIRRIVCPQCGRVIEYARVSDIATFPFCSARCRLADLDKWFEGDYRISANPADDGLPGTPGEDKQARDSGTKREKS